MNKHTCSLYVLGYYAAMKITVVVIYATTWTDLEMKKMTNTV
jgi:hypothetical protein